jgi:O-antigen/teichoic acid export membrane protein
VSAFTKAIRYSMVLQAVFLAPLTVWAKPVTSLALGPGYGESAHVLLALAPYVFLSGPALIVSVGVNYLGEARRRIPIAVTAIAVNTVLDVILIPRIGVIAGAIGTSIAFTIYVAGHVWVCRQAIALPLGPLALTCLRTLVAAGMAALVLAAFGTEHLSPFDWVAGTVCGTLAYVLVLVVTREVGRAEWGRVRSFLRRVPGLRAR